ncbi:MAG TPA: PA2169 family four-helix-bundle protein [Blastocatellia bacterium]|nr:PA2169 family four-helix-bundle protein [Blastocatellia bacterium]HMV82918.1 PA2169 family four-helix-bundle protein [Blastocatellia bacterium]HMX25315.1 PA2169 family four-helix-bundle protein [Blastocatellia bacterium]HMY70451.1 PA2169 family four-helix-bundle protein [Blastocatellia bacterium]HMZ17059.1 PA2169 family four-helix-bundle protein [Blastocatellia bacterium]
MKTDQSVSTLNNLIETCRDGQNGFADAAEHIENPQIRTFCLEQSRMRAQFVGELQQEAAALGGDPENSGSAAAALHRTWIDLKSALGGGDHAILAACETGEDSAVKAYDNALKEALPVPVRAVVERQRQSVKQAHDRVKNLRDQLK